MTSLSAIVVAMKSEASLYAARGLDSQAAALNAYIPQLEALAGIAAPIVGVLGPISSDLTTGGAGQIIGWKPETIARHARAGSFTSAYTVPGGGWRIPAASVASFMHCPNPEQSPEPIRPIGLAPMSHRKEGFDREQFVAPFRSSTSTGRVT
jgi:hypothetical protein